MSASDFINISSQHNDTIIQENDNNDINTPLNDQFFKRPRTISHTSHSNSFTESMVRTKSSHIGSNASTLKVLTSLNPTNEKLSIAKILDECKLNNWVHIKYSIHNVFLQFDIILYEHLSYKEVKIQTIFSNCKHFEIFFDLEIKYGNLLEDLSELKDIWNETFQSADNAQEGINEISINTITDTQLESMKKFFNEHLLNEQILYDLQQVLKNEYDINLNIFFWNKETLQPELFFEGELLPYQDILDKVDWNNDNDLFVVNSGETTFNIFTLYQKTRA